MNVLHQKALFSSLVLGAERIATEGGIATLSRFNQAEEAYYAEGPNSQKTKSSSGIRLRFLTDSKTLTLGVRTSSASSRTYFAIDVFVDGARIGDLANFSEEGRVLSPDGEDEGEAFFPLGSFPHGDFQKTFSLGEGEKTVTVYLPGLASTLITALEVEDGATVSPLRPPHTLLIYGDSITQGYDGRHPSSTYSSLVTDFLDAEGFNKAIGGEIFCPALAALAIPRDYDYVTVAYGTNDWGRGDRAAFERNASLFLSTLAKKHPAARIFILTPIWRGGVTVERIAESEGTPADYGDFLAAECKKYSNMQVIRCEGFVPADPALFADGRLHPNDEGYALYAEGVKGALDALLGGKEG